MLRRRDVSGGRGLEPLTLVGAHQDHALEPLLLREAAPDGLERDVLRCLVLDGRRTERDSSLPRPRTTPSVAPRHHTGTMQVTLTLTHTLTLKLTLTRLPDPSLTRLP